MAEQKKPNVLLIMSDDVGWFDVGATFSASWVQRHPISTALRMMA